MKKQIIIDGLVNVVTSIEQLEALALTLSVMKDIYNELTGSTISKFSDKKTALRRVFEALPEYVEPAPVAVAEGLEGEFVHHHLQNLGLLPLTYADGAKNDRDIMRSFLQVGRVFKIADVAELLNTSHSNANTGVQLLKSRPGKHHQPLVVEKVGPATYKFIQAPNQI